jgi:DNA-binding response OmpR family regulator
MEQAHTLVVDDEAALCYMLRHSLQKAGYIVHIAHSGPEALELFASIPFDVVLLDVNLPGMDGFALCAELRSRSNVLIIFITADNQPQTVAYGYSLGADDYITKPFQLRELTTRIQRLLPPLACHHPPTLSPSVG